MALDPEVLGWINTLELNLEFRNPKRDFANGCVVAEILARYFPEHVTLHSFENVCSLPLKEANWHLLKKVLRRLGFVAPDQLINQVMLCEDGAAPTLMRQLWQFLIGHQSTASSLAGPAATEQQNQMVLPGTATADMPWSAQQQSATPASDDQFGYGASSAWQSAMQPQQSTSLQPQQQWSAYDAHMWTQQQQHQQPTGPSLLEHWPSQQAPNMAQTWCQPTSQELHTWQQQQQPPLQPQTAELTIDTNGAKPSAAKQGRGRKFSQSQKRPQQRQRQQQQQSAEPAASSMTTIAQAAQPQSSSISASVPMTMWSQPHMHNGSQQTVVGWVLPFGSMLASMQQLDQSGGAAASAHWWLDQTGQQQTRNETAAAAGQLPQVWQVSALQQAPEQQQQQPVTATGTDAGQPATTNPRRRTAKTRKRASARSDVAAALSADITRAADGDSNTQSGWQMALAQPVVPADEVAAQQQYWQSPEMQQYWQQHAMQLAAWQQAQMGWSIAAAGSQQESYDQNHQPGSNQQWPTQQQQQQQQQQPPQEGRAQAKGGTAKMASRRTSKQSHHQQQQQQQQPQILPQMLPQIQMQDGTSVLEPALQQQMAPLQYGQPYAASSAWAWGPDAYQHANMQSAAWQEAAQPSGAPDYASSGSARTHGDTYDDDGNVDQPTLAFSRQPRPVEFQPYSIEDFRPIDARRADKYWELGLLGPVPDERLQEKLELKQRVKEFGRSTTRVNHERLEALKAASAPSTPLERPPSSRERALMFSKSIRRPTSSRSSTSAHGIGPDSTSSRPQSSVESPEARLLREVEQLEIRHQLDAQLVAAATHEIHA